MMPSMRKLRYVVLLCLACFSFMMSARAEAATPPCTELPPTAWINTPKVNVKVVINWQLDRVPSAKELYLNAMCGAQPNLIWGLIDQGEGAVITIPPLLAESLDVAIPWLPRVDYMYVRGGGRGREVVVFLFTNGYTGPFFAFDRNMEWREAEVRRAEVYWNALPYEYMRRAAHWLHDAAKFDQKYTVHTELFGGLIKIPVFTMIEPRALANPMGSMLMAEGGDNDSAGANLWIHELAHYNHYYFSGMSALPWVDDFTSITRENRTILGVSIPFWFTELYSETHGYCDADRDYQPHGYVTKYARCGETALVEDFSDTLSIALGTTQYIRQQIEEGSSDFRLYNPSSASSYNPDHYKLDYLYDRGAGADAAVMGEKLSFIYDMFGYHPSLPQDADGNGISWTPGHFEGDCDDRNPVVEECVHVYCEEDVDCDDGDACTTGTCRGDRCVYEIRDRDNDGFPDGVCGGNDCDDTDPTIGHGSTRECSNAHCGILGVETCLNGAWTSCSAPVECTCTPGDFQITPCGNCGTKTRVCDENGEWGDEGPCMNQGVCSPEVKDSEKCGVVTCGGEQVDLEQRLVCSSSCQWQPDGQCELPEQAPAEVCDGVDNNCNGVVDEGCPVNLSFINGASGPFYGGSGGSEKTTNCPAGEVMTGFDLTAGTYTVWPFYQTSVIAGLRPICRKMDLVTSGSPYSYSIERTGAQRRLAWHGSGNHHASYECPANQVLRGFSVKGGTRVRFVDHIQFHCGSLTINGSIGSYSPHRVNGVNSSIFFEGSVNQTYNCPGIQVATGLRSRHGNVTDAVAFNCSTPNLNNQN